MRLGVIGLGSMGKRRVRDLAALGHEVAGFDIREDRNAEAAGRFGIPTVSSFERLRGLGVEAIAISTPPDQHLSYYEACFDASLPFFSEANILTPTAEWFAQREARAGVRSYSSCTMRMHPLVAALRTELAAGGAAVLSVQAHYASYLPLWHPWERYTDFYAGRSKKTSAARETVPFEADWLSWILGPVAEVSGSAERRAQWDSDIDDTYMLLLRFESGVCASLNVEMAQVSPSRGVRVACAGRSYELDLTAHQLRRYDLESDSWRILKPAGTPALGAFHYEQIYRAEMEAFTAALSDGTADAAYPKRWSEDRHASTVLYAAEESARTRRWTSIGAMESRYDGRSWVCE